MRVKSIREHKGRSGLRDSGTTPLGTGMGNRSLLARCGLSPRSEATGPRGESSRPGMETPPMQMPWLRAHIGSLAHFLVEAAHSGSSTQPEAIQKSPGESCYQGNSLARLQVLFLQRGDEKLTKGLNPPLILPSASPAHTPVLLS